MIYSGPVVNLIRKSGKSNQKVLGKLDLKKWNAEECHVRRCFAVGSRISEGTLTMNAARVESFTASVADSLQKSATQNQKSTRQR